MTNIKQLIALKKNLTNAQTNINSLECTCIQDGVMCRRCDWATNLIIILQEVEEEINKLK
jgi:hypothetical protein